MSQAVYKYGIGLSGDTVEMLKGAKVLSVQRQRYDVCVWALVDPAEREKERRKFVLVGTGHTFDEPWAQFLGTVQFDDGYFVAHVFEVLP